MRLRTNNAPTGSLHDDVCDACCVSTHVEQAQEVYVLAGLSENGIDVMQAVIFDA